MTTLFSPATAVGYYEKTVALNKGDDSVVIAKLPKTTTYQITVIAVWGDIGDYEIQLSVVSE